MEYIHVKGPVIIAMNHPNAFADPILFTFLSYPVRVRYLARGDAFKPGLISWLLQQIGIVPIFRIQDGGREGLKKNDEAYRRVNKLLKRNGKIIVFAEGLCIQERRLRPLKKGVSRMVFGAYEYLGTEDLTVVPVGVNYSAPDKFRSTAFFNIGKPILVKDYIESFRSNPAKANKLFLQDLEPKMKDLITHINNKRYDEVVRQIETLCKRNILIHRGADPSDLEENYLASKEITAWVNEAEITDQTTLEEFKTAAEGYFNQLKKNKLRDWLIDPEQQQKVSAKKAVIRVLLLIMGLPFYAMGLIGNYLPYKSTEKLSKKLVKGNVEFYASICIGIGMVFAWLNYIIWFTVIYSFSSTIFIPLLVCLVFILCGWFSMYFFFFIKKTMGLLRAVKNPQLIDELRGRRAQLLSLINKFAPLSP